MKGTNRFKRNWKKSLRIFFLAGMLGLAACNRGVILNKTCHAPQGAWSYKDPIVFECYVEDTTIEYDAIFSIKHRDDYRWSNAFFLITTVFPDMETRVDTLECLLANRSGKWIGHRYGKYHGIRFLYKQGIRFPQNGEYRFEVRHAMREDVYEILTVGMKISPH